MRFTCAYSSRETGQGAHFLLGERDPVPERDPYTDHADHLVAATPSRTARPRPRSPRPAGSSRGRRRGGVPGWRCRPSSRGGGCAGRRGGVPASVDAPAGLHVSLKGRWSLRRRRAMSRGACSCATPRPRAEQPVGGRQAGSAGTAATDRGRSRLHAPQVPPALPVQLRQALLHQGAQGGAVTRPPHDPRHRGGERSLEQTRPDRATPASWEGALRGAAAGVLTWHRALGNVGASRFPTPSRP